MSWKKVKLRNLVTDLASGGRPKGGATDHGVFSIGAEHLNGIGGFNVANPKYIPIEYFKSIGNGKIKTNDILLVKDGATTGKVSYVDDKFPFEEAAINEHVFRVELNTTLIFPKFCYYYFISNLGQREIMSDFRGATVGGISKEILDKIQIPLPLLPTQKRIAEILDAADALRRKDQELLRKYDELAQAIFIDMFGDPVKNEKGWEVKKLKEFGKVQTGNTPPREEKRFYGSFIEWIKTDNILLEKLNPLQATEYLSEEGLKKGRYVDSGSVLVTCIAGSSKSIGNVVLTNRRVSFNQQINSLTPKSSYNKLFIYALFRYSKSIIQDNTTQGMKRIITKSTFENLKFISPPIELQNEFEQKYKVLLKLIDSINFQQKSSENLFDSLLQQAFKGELVK